MRSSRSVRRIVLACSLTLAAAGCASPKYVHAVFFTCKPGTCQSEIDALVADGRELLAGVPSVRRLETGRRDTTAVREVNVTDYDVGLVVHFDDRQALENYLEHPAHIQYVEKHKPHWAAVRVYDFITD